jgi:AcrR family transcriptional regulator
MQESPGITTVPADARGRLLEGLAVAIVEKGYVATTIADIVRHARVSKRTFYEHFADKEACYLELYSAASDHMLAVIAEAAAAEAPWRERLDAATRAYLTELGRIPALTRTFLMEIQAAGPRALALRREVHGRFAQQLQALTEVVATEEPRVHALTPAMATAVVGGVNELMLQAVEEGRTQRLSDLAETATALILAVVTGPVAAE